MLYFKHLIINASNIITAEFRPGSILINKSANHSTGEYSKRYRIEYVQDGQSPDAYILFLSFFGQKQVIVYVQVLGVILKQEAQSHSVSLK